MFVSLCYYLYVSFVLQTRRDFGWLENISRFSSSRGNSVLSASRALRRFQKWLRRAKFLPNYDHAVLFTRYRYINLFSIVLLLLLRPLIWVSVCPDFSIRSFYFNSFSVLWLFSYIHTVFIFTQNIAQYFVLTVERSDIHLYNMFPVLSSYVRCHSYVQIITKTS